MKKKNNTIFCFQVRDLLCTFVNVVKKTVKKKGIDLDISILWFSNTLRLLHLLKQYSGEPIFQEENTPTQNAQCLQYFDLFEYRQVLTDTGVWIYQVKCIFDFTRLRFRMPKYYYVFIMSSIIFFPLEYYPRNGS